MPSATEVSNRKDQMDAQVVQSENNLNSVRSIATNCYTRTTSYIFNKR